MKNLKKAIKVVARELHLTAKKSKVKIKVKHPDILNIPEGKKFWQMPQKHYLKLIEKQGWGSVFRALNNIRVWNKKKNPDVSKKADELIKKLRKKIKK